MKSIKTTIIALVAALSLGSCDFLDKEPTSATSDTYLKTETEAESFLRGVYAILTQTPFYGGNYFYLVGGDDLEHFGGSGRAPLSSGLICNNATSSDPYVAAFWYDLYAGVNRANILISQIDGIQDMSTQNKARFKAEARFLRAFYYFNLVECWGDVPFRTDPVLDQGNLQQAVTPKAEIYDFICSEMADAANDLPTAAALGNEPGRVSKSAAWGLLARVYMFRAGEHYRDNVAADAALVKNCFEQADKYAKLVKAEGGHKLAPNYWDYFIDQCADRYNSTANESIWEAEFAGNGTGTMVTEGRVGNIIGPSSPDLSSKTAITGKKDPGYSYCFFWSTPKLYELYVENGDINRMNWSIMPFRYTQSVSGNGVDGREFEVGKMAEVKQQYWDESFQYGDATVGSTTGDREKKSASTRYDRECGKWRREYEKDKKAKNLTAINFPILRYADVLLMIAECENELNDAPTQEAYDCINAVRERAGIAPLSGLDKDGFRQAVKDERAMELCFEMTRRFDLIRWGEYVKDMNALVSRAQSGTNWNLGPTNVYTYFDITSSYLYFPIPATEMSVNKLIKKNNPGW